MIDKTIEPPKLRIGQHTAIMPKRLIDGGGEHSFIELPKNYRTRNVRLQIVGESLVFTFDVYKVGGKKNA